MFLFIRGVSGACGARGGGESGTGFWEGGRGRSVSFMEGEAID